MEDNWRLSTGDCPSFVIRHSGFVILSSFGFRHSSFFLSTFVILAAAGLTLPLPLAKLPLRLGWGLTLLWESAGKRRIDSNDSNRGAHNSEKELQPMQAHLSALVVLSALSGGTRESTIYDDYKQAWRAGRVQNLPVLVILNPADDAEAAPVDVDSLTRSSHRRKLLANYVVAVIDTSTPQGEKVHKLFQSPTLPRVSVLDREQKWQIYRSSETHSAEDWNLVLEQHQKGNPPPPPAPRPAAQCLT
jgi:hypothetical protein